MKIRHVLISSATALSLCFSHITPAHAETESTTTSETTEVTTASEDSSSGSSEDEVTFLKSLLPWVGILSLLWFIGKSYPTPSWFPKIGF